jgi:hypothetical protein
MGPSAQSALASGALALTVYQIVLHYFDTAKQGHQGPIFKIFSANSLAKILAFFAQATASFFKNFDHNIGF